MITAVRRLQFSAGHRVHGHESKCANLHGHNYVVFLHAQAPLDAIGRVIDFSVLKELFGRWIDEKWDHGFIICHDDVEVRRAFNQEELIAHKHFVAPFNPTAEEMAKYILNTIGPELLRGTGVKLTKVVLWETENCFAEVSINGV